MNVDVKAAARAMVDNGIGARVLAEQAGISICTAYRFINGGKVKPETFAKVAEVLGVKPSELLKV